MAKVYVPCPECGKELVYIMLDGYDRFDATGTVQCPGCSVTTAFELNWVLGNTLHRATPIVDPLEKLKRKNAALVKALRADDAWFRHSRECTDCMAGAICDKGLALYHDANGARQSALAAMEG